MLPLLSIYPFIFFAKVSVYSIYASQFVINKGAHDSLSSHMATSLLPIGILEIDGEFKKGDIIRILDEKRQEIGLGQAMYNSKKATSLIGVKNQKPIIHYDHLYLH